MALANGVINPDLIYVGQPLVIPAATPSDHHDGSTHATQTITVTPRARCQLRIANRLHIVQADETLFGLALRYGTTMQSFIDANQLDRAGFIVPGQPLIIPSNARSNEAGIAQPRTPLPAPFTGLDFGPLPLQQGSLMEITVRTTQPVSLTGSSAPGIFPSRQMVIITSAWSVSGRIRLAELRRGYTTWSSRRPG